MAGRFIKVPQQEGEIVVTFPGLRRVPLAVVDGYVTVHDDELANAVLSNVDGAEAVQDAAPDFLPDEHTVAEVNEYLGKHPNEAPAVLAAEAEGRNRKGITEGPHAPEQPAEPAEESAE